MSPIRRHVRLLVVAVLVCQVGSVAAFALRTCCTAHGSSTHAAAADKTEPACPAHEPPKDPECTMRGVCDSPLALLSQAMGMPGLPSLPVALFPDTSVASAPAAAPFTVQIAFSPHDSPPPRS